MRKKFKFSTFTIVCLVLYIVTFMLIFPNVSQARYLRQTNDNGNNLASVADFEFIVENKSDSFAVNLADKIKKPGDSASYSFVVRNYDEELSEVPIQYSITLEVVGNMPLECSLLKDSESQFTISTLNTTKNTFTGIMDVLETEVGFMVNINWPEDKNDGSYFEQDAIGVVFISVEATQID